MMVLIVHHVKPHATCPVNEYQVVKHQLHYLYQFLIKVLDVEEVDDSCEPSDSEYFEHFKGNDVVVVPDFALVVLLVQL